MKQFVFGCIVGALAAGACAHLFYSHAPERAQTNAPAPASKDTRQASADAASSALKKPASEQTPRLEFRTASMDPQCPQPIVVNRCGDCSWAHECLRQEAQQQETARAGEEKDPTWAYSTEQLLGEYLAASVARGKLQITGVDCRTTYCEVNATSADARSPEQLAKPIMDALAQGGLDLSPNMATDVGYDDGVWKLHSIISRKSKEASR